MPMSGGSRMLRARRKDCNVKPNRRLDRKSSRGMLFENEELRMRTITINAEVEQGQHALKKLRRENEQLRREMWCLRDEYDKMEKLLRKREEGEESDQENSDSDDNAPRTDESDEEKRGLRQLAQQEANPDLETEGNLQKFSQFGNEANVRTFDGLSVIDEQTEETQTTESAGGYGTLSRGNSANRTFHPPIPLQDEACRLPDVPPYGYDSFGDKPHRKRGVCLYENGAAFPQEWAAGDTYDVRPASPYPYTGSFRPSYRKQFQALQELPLVPQTPANAIGENGWIFPDPEKLPDVPGYNVYMEDSFLPGKLPDGCAGEFGFDLIQNRGGPDVFVTGGYSQVSNQIVASDSVEKVQKGVEGDPQELIHNVEAEIDKIDISDNSEMDPKMREITTLTKAAVLRDEVGPAAVPQEPRETARSGKLTMDAAAQNSDSAAPNDVQQLVLCQNSGGQHVRETTDSAHSNPPTDDMPLAEKPGSKYQTKLMVTLKAPAGRPDGRAPKKLPGPAAPRPCAPHPRCCPGAPAAPAPATDPCPVAHCAGPRAPGGAGPFGSLPKLPAFVPRSDLCVTPSNIPEEFDKDLDVLPDEESPTVPVKQSLGKPVKIPPVPPPRTSSCPKPIIPPPPVGLTALHQRTFGKGTLSGKSLQSQDSLDRHPEPTIFNPLLMSQPIATSSPTISLKGNRYPDAAADSLYSSKYRKPAYNEDSSLEEFSRQKFKFRDEFPRADVPKLNKSLSSPSFGSFRTPRRKQSEAMATSVENILGQKLPEAERGERKGSKSRGAQSNASVSSSSGLESPAKGDGRKRRVSIQFKKRRGEDEGGGKESGDSRRESGVPGILSAKGKGRGKGEETDATTSDRERTNSVSSRTSSVVGGGSGRRKYSVSSNRTYLNDEKIPWCGCWGNGCV